MSASDEPITITVTFAPEEIEALVKTFRGRAIAVFAGLDRHRPEDEALRKIALAVKAWDRGWM